MLKFCPNCGHEARTANNNGFKCENCQYSVYINSKPAAGIIPIYRGKVLIAIRGREPFKGFLDTIGGFLENGEDPITGSIREFKEETGENILGSELKFLGHFMSPYTFQDEELNVLNIVYTLNFSEFIQPEPKDDVEDLLWISLDEDLGKYKLNKYMKEVFQTLQEKIK